MISDQYISVRETAQILGITEKKVMDLVDNGKLQAYKIAEQFLRLKRNEVLSLRSGGEIAADRQYLPYTGSEKIKDFFYFNDFYILSGIIVACLLYVIFQMN